MISVKIKKATRNETENAAGNPDGDTKKDIKIAGTCKSADLRPERKNTGNGCVYTIYLSVSVASGNTGTASFKVFALITRGSSMAVENGPAYTLYSY